MHCAIGIDVGGTKIAGGLVDLDSGRVRERQEIPTLPARGGSAVLDDALALAARLVRHGQDAGLDPVGVGVGVPELVDAQGRVTSHQTIGWDTLPVQARFSDLLPAVVESDVRAAALAEARYGAGCSYRQFVYVTVGTGISHTLVLDGRPFAGARGNALIFASGTLTLQCPHCGQPVSHVLEEYASGPALVRRYNELSGQTAQDGQAVITAAANREQAAVTVVCSAGEALGVGVAWLVNTLDPEAVVVGGGLGLAGGLYWKCFVTALRQHIWAAASRELPVAPAQLGVDAGVVGAAACCADMEVSEPP